MRTIFILTLFLATAVFASVSKPKPVPKPNLPIISYPKGYGTFERNQKAIRHFMNAVGWKPTEQYEETGWLIKDLLLIATKKDSEVRAWLESVSIYMATAEFKSQTKAKKQEEIFQAKLYAKMAISDIALAK